MSVRSVNQGSHTVLYKAENPWVEQVKKNRRHLSELCGRHYNRPVRVQTIDGHTYEGVIVGTDGCHLHLMTQPPQSAPDGQRFYNPYQAAAITTLVLFELLVITLLI
ncbi:acetyl-CoA acetyltransferase [Cohnella sp. AR92]|uniref:acetyl-CoA acetyltransferase n=1 Tax=Cohnella sp. AR92 TaxID=648716 RepID=UPI000F8D08C7|nr:acetyl-CoA acetyltransferase [Cohnella sp. AR92]RUS49161.1 acetyl-CoA acetyltransferase [Cohnella sp. AR92]